MTRPKKKPPTIPLSVVARLPDADTLRVMTKYKPVGALLPKWQRLHRRHIVALATGKMCEACILAEAKYQVWRESVGMP